MNLTSPVCGAQTHLRCTHITRWHTVLIPFAWWARWQVVIYFTRITCMNRVSNGHNKLWFKRNNVSVSLILVREIKIWAQTTPNATLEWEKIPNNLKHSNNFEGIFIISASDLRLFTRQPISAKHSFNETRSRNTVVRTIFDTMPVPAGTLHVAMNVPKWSIAQCVQTHAHKCPCVCSYHRAVVLHRK